MTTRNKKQSLKIIAIRPLAGCHENYLKIIHAKELYFFYNNYSIDKRDKISLTEIIPSDFYQINNINVNICAVVGKNGSGKSTLIDILFRAINNFASNHAIVTAELQKIPNLKVDVFFHTDSYYKMRISNSIVEVFGYDSGGNILKPKLENFRLQQFFYTIAVNYSHYAYNTEDLEDEVNWLDGVFHKNDGYQTPLVINPMRTKGIIDINNENHLVKSRLIGNLLRPVKKGNFSFRKLTDNLEAVSLNLKLNSSKHDKIIYENEHDQGELTEQVSILSLNFNTEDLLEGIDKRFHFNYKLLDKDEFRLALDYIIYKVVSIATKYEEYLHFFDKKEKVFKERDYEKFINQLFNDESHITFKLRQTINFLKYQHIELKNQNIDLNTLSKRISTIKTGKKRREITEFVPPPIFTIDILLKTEDGLKSEIEFRRLSSGEKQMIYSVSSLLYHLINLNSIRNSKKRTKYNFVNIVLEEIELYFHPEMQRTYINYILESIKKLELGLSSINFCFVTHSPFILSDIPDSNILFLDDKGHQMKATEKVRTFGGNIHELLAHSFFLNKGFVGEFAKNKIQSIIDFLISKKQYNDTKNREVILQEIQLVGEPFLKEKLMEMYYIKFEKQQRILELENELSQLKNND